VGVGKTAVGSKKSEVDEAGKTVFWRSDKAAGITLGQKAWNFKSKKDVEEAGVVVLVPSGRVALVK
jgi:hypothetical protein